MSDLSIELHWQRAEPVLQTGKYSNEHTVLFNNAFDVLVDSAPDWGGDPAVRVVSLAANGPAFCAGHDLKEMTAGRADDDGGKAYFAKIMALCSGVMQGIVNCPKPVIAEVTGGATAAGCQLVASCDLAIAADSAQFSTPGVHIGLVNRALAVDALLEATGEVARKIVSKSNMTLATGKRAFYAQREMPLTEAYAYASQVMVDNMLARDAQDGISAFIEKRQPQWQDA